MTALGTPGVSTHPGVHSGVACVEGHRLPCRAVARYYLYRGLEEVTDAYGLTRSEVLVACWWVARHGRRRWRRVWGSWLREHGEALWSSEGWDAVPLPPRDAP